MPNLVKKSHLQDVLLDLWNKIQGKLNAYVHKTQENSVYGKTVLYNAHIGGSILATLNNTGATHTMTNNTSTYTSEKLLISANQKVGKVTIGVADSKQLGETVTGVTIGAVNPINGKVLDYIIQDGTAKVHVAPSELGCNKAITVDVDATWILDVYLIVGANGALWGDRGNYGGKAWGGTKPTVNATLPLVTTGNYIGKAMAFGETVSLQDLASGNSVGVSRQEFNIHKLENSEQFQTVQNSINTTNGNVNSQGQRITNLERNSVRLNAPNRFTSKNTFYGRSPVIDKYFSIKNIDGGTNVSLYTDRNFCCNPKEGITRAGVNISALLLPIFNSRPGDTIRASYFIYDAGNGKIMAGMDNNLSTYTVQDIEYKGHHCIVLNVNQIFNYSVGFGFRVDDTVTTDSRRIGLMKQDVSSDRGWSTYHPLSMGATLGGGAGNAGRFVIPYAITQKAESEVVTRFDLANTTFPIDTVHLGELKFLAYDAGEVTEINGRTWVRCDGQTVSSSEYNELCKAIQPTSEVSVDFKLPSNNSPVGYTYICAK